MNNSKKKFNKQFSRIKIKIFFRDKWECQLNKEKHSGKLDCHHIIARGQGGGNEKENLIILCRQCHEEIELLPRNKSIPLLRKILSKKYRYRY